MSRNIKIICGLLCFLALTHIVVPLIMWSAADRLFIEIKNGHPEFDTAEINKSVAVAQNAAIIFHSVFLLLSVLLITGIARGKNWARILAIVISILSIIFSFVSWKSSSMFHWLVIVSDIVQVIIICLLLSSKETKEYFKVKNQNKISD